MKLTDVKCRMAKAAAKDFKLSDGFGLYLLVKSNGSKHWKWKYYFNGKERKLSLGSYPTVSVKLARQLLSEHRALLASGIDPSHDRKMKRLQVQYSTATTFKAVGEEYIEKMVKEGRATTTLIKARWMFDILSVKLGGRPVAEIKPLEVLQVLKELEAKGQLETARKVRALASRIFRYAIATERAEHDPCPALRGAIAAPQVKNHAALLDPAEIGGLMRAIRTYSGDPIVRLALEFSAHVFQRPGEVRQANWNEFDFEKNVWVIPPERMKMRLPHRVPLSSRTIALLEELREMTGNCKYVFPSLRSAQRPMSENTVNAALRRMGYTSDEMTAHGFRAMASTQLNESGRFSYDAIERALAHKDNNHIRGIYDRGSRWSERVELHNWWSDLLQQLEASVDQKRAA